MFSIKPAVRLLALLTVLAGTLVTQATAQEDVRVLTDTFRPFVLPPDEAEGPATRLMDMVLQNAGYEQQIDYIDFAYAFHAMGEGREVISFPWRKTPERMEYYTYSVPLFSLETMFHYNIRYHPGGLALEDVGAGRIGTTASYQYGDEITALIDGARDAGNLREYLTEAEALEALLSGEVDALPLPVSVVSATLRTQFPDELRLIRTVDGLTDPFELHAIAPKTPWGQQVMSAFNASYAELVDAGVIGPDYVRPSNPHRARGDIGILVPAEGFPVAIGIDLHDESASYAVPQGTRVLVLNWSTRITEPTKAERLYVTMVDESEVLILNGPHLGKELRIKNMHIAIAE